MLLGLVKGDSIELEITTNIDISDWKIRCEIFDANGSSIKLATSNSGGSNAQIEIIDAINGVFLLKVLKGLTTNFNNSANIEIEREEDEKILTIYQDEIKFNSEKINWTAP